MSWRTRYLRRSQAPDTAVAEIFVGRLNVYFFRLIQEVLSTKDPIEGGATYLERIFSVFLFLSIQIDKGSMLTLENENNKVK